MAARALRSILRRKGWTVSHAEDLQTAMRLIEELPDWILLDLMLPDGDGAELLGLVRERGLPIRVMVTTGSADRHRLDLVLGLGPDYLFQKPIDLEQLLRRLEEECP